MLINITFVVLLNGFAGNL